MKFKQDENFGKRTQQPFRMAGHDVQTVREERLQGSSDKSIYDHCCGEQRCLVTLELDFADVTRFSPNQTAGIAVIRVPKNPTLTLLESLIRQFLHALNTASVNKQLWIIEIGRIRVHQSESATHTGVADQSWPRRPREIAFALVGLRRCLSDVEPTRRCFKMGCARGGQARIIRKRIKFIMIPHRRMAHRARLGKADHHFPLPNA